MTGKIYPIGLVGESNYQAAIRDARVNEPVYIRHEPDNPYDDKALLVETGAGRTLGYIAKSSWLRDAIHDQGRGAAATIKSIGAGEERSHLGVVIDVTLTDDDVFERSYDEHPALNDPPSKDGLARLLKGLLKK